jgi:hypothetical protein
MLPWKMHTGNARTSVKADRVISDRIGPDTAIFSQPPACTQATYNFQRTQHLHLPLSNVRQRVRFVVQARSAPPCDPDQQAGDDQSRADSLTLDLIGQPVNSAAPVPKEFAVWRDGVLNEAGFSWGEDHWIYEDYVEWSMEQLRMGLVPTIDGFIRYTQEERKKDDPPLPRPQDLLYPSAAD